MMFLNSLLLFAAAVGHACILVYSLNWWYGLALPKQLLKAMKLIHGFLVVLGLSAFALALFTTDPLESLGYHPSAWRLTALVYTMCCAAIGGIALPVITLRRALRGKPSVLKANDTVVIDVAKQLGYKPAGRSKKRKLARLPGNEVFQVDFSERILVLPGLPAAWNGLSILHLSDLHFAGSPDRRFFQEVMRRCRDWSPDIVGLTGDYVDGQEYHSWILGALGWLKWNVAGLAVLGNHDSWYNPDGVRRRLTRMGIQVLSGRWVLLEVRGLPTIVVGNERPWMGSIPEMNGCPKDIFRLCLSHTPDNIGWARQNQINLMLSGHVHGGQIRIPLIGSVLVPSIYSRRYDCGTFFEPPTVMHVSRGLSGDIPLRYNCRPEVTKIILRTPSGGS